MSEFGRLVAEANAALAAMTPLERAIHDDEQRRSFLAGQSGHKPAKHVFRYEIERLERSLSEARERAERAEAALAGDATLSGLQMDERGLTMGLKHPLIPLLADVLAKQVDGANYVEMRFTHTQTGDEYLLHCQRLSRPTPHELRQRAESRASALEAALRELITHEQYAALSYRDIASRYSAKSDSQTRWLNARRALSEGGKTE